MNTNDNVSEEIVIVGSGYGELSDEFECLFSQEKPIEEKDIRKTLGDNIVYMMPVCSVHDDQAVGVYSQTERLLGYVWMYQAHALRCWLETRKLRYVAARIKEAIPLVHVLTAVIEQPVELLTDAQSACEVDELWAQRLPEELMSSSEHRLDLGLQLLDDELAAATKWNDLLKLRIDNLLRSIPQDPSSYRYQKYMKVYNMMKHSDIEEVRAQSCCLLSTMVDRGSAEHMKWWLEEWLPSYFDKAAEGDLLGMFEADHYTLDRVEGLLDAAPEHLFHHYQVNPLRFANRLYHATLPQPIYNRLLTLLAVRDAMIKKSGKKDKLYVSVHPNTDEELFRFIHPSMDSAQERQIHIEVKRLVAHHAMQEICLYLYQLKEEKKILLPMNAATIYAELVRVGMPQVDGYSMKNFQKYYKR